MGIMTPHPAGGCIAQSRQGESVQTKVSTAEEDPVALLRSICCRRKRLNPMSDLIIFSRYRKRQSVTAQATAKMSSQSYCVPTGD